MTLPSTCLWYFDTELLKSSFVIASNCYKLWQDSEIISLFFVGSALAQRRNRWLARMGIVKCLLLLCHYLIMPGSWHYCCASSESSFAVVPFHPAYLIPAGCTAVTLVTSPWTAWAYRSSSWAAVCLHGLSGRCWDWAAVGDPLLGAFSIV